MPREPAGGLRLAAAGPRAVNQYVDCSELRLGDRIALAWYAQHRRLESGLAIGVVDAHAMLGAEFALPRYFPDTFAPVVGDPVAQGLERWDHGNLWLTAANAFASSRRAGHFEHVPDEVQICARELRRTAAVPRILIHVLDDASYNFARNWKRHDANALGGRLRQLGAEVVLLNPEPSCFMGNFERMLAEMLACDLFIGGDTGPSHVFALLCPDRPQISIYPSMARDRQTYAGLQHALGLPLPWNSLPLRPNLNVVELAARRTLAWRGIRPRIRRIGRFDPYRVASLAVKLAPVP